MYLRHVCCKTILEVINPIKTIKEKGIDKIKDIGILQEKSKIYLPKFDNSCACELSLVLPICIEGKTTITDAHLLIKNVCTYEQKCNRKHKV